MPTPTPTPLPSPTVGVELPPDGSHTAVVHLPPDVLNKLYPHDHGPNLAEWCTAIGTLLLVLTAILAGVFTYFGIRQARGIQHAQTLLEISRRWNETRFREGRIRIRNFYESKKDPEEVRIELLKLKDENETQYWESLMTLDFFEIMAMNIKYKSITFKMVYDVFGSVVCLYWAMLSGHVEKQHADDPDSKKYYVEFENLANKINAFNEMIEKKGYGKCEESEDGRPVRHF
jgi:hypothetical protein